MRIHLALVLVFVAGSTQAQQPPFDGPPPEAKQACNGRQQGDSCQFTSPRGSISGSCRIVPEGDMACVPAGMGPPGGMGPMGGRAPMQPLGMAPPQQGGPANGLPRQPKAQRVNISRYNPQAVSVSSRIPDTGQGSCFDAENLARCPDKGQPFYGQDAQYSGAEPSYRDNRDGTVSDTVTGLMWQQAHNAKRLGWGEAGQACQSMRLGGHDDWRLPTIRELYSIADFRGAAGVRPYLDDIFEIHEPDASIVQGDRFAASHRTDMMGQTWSSTLYVGDHWGRKGVEAAFFMNFLDGRIKQAPTGGKDGLFYRCVRGEKWGDNDFVDNGDGTVTDRASRLTWQQLDDGKTRNWEQALEYCEGLNLAGHGDWRLPNVKELQSIVDYSRSDPALDTRYLRQSDRKGWFWSSTTLGDNIAQAAYVCFGKCTSAEGVDVHGAGAQRSDPKAGSAEAQRSQGGQNDEIRIDNFVRCVR